LPREYAGKEEISMLRSSVRQRRGRKSNLHPSPPLRPTQLTEPDLIMLLSDPEVRMVMRADHVDEHELAAMLNSISVQLREAPHDPGTKNAETHSPSSTDDAEYRPGVGIVLLNDRNEIFVGRRADVEADAWQLPQGGINRGESPREAALRELVEEIGTEAVDIIAESSRWLYYEVPDEFARKAWNGRWKGQRQKWFMMLFRGRDSDINVATLQPEFNAWRWVPVGELTALAVSFRRQLYTNVLGEFPTIFRD
jgi:putative (di)nucleoside polyphosphate hydrolase